jgi:hypothetical protein
MGRRVVALIVFLMFSSSSSITTRGSEMSETCFGNCMTLLREAFEVSRYTTAEKIKTLLFTFVTDIWYCDIVGFY